MTNSTALATINQFRDTPLTGCVGEIVTKEKNGCIEKCEVGIEFQAYSQNDIIFNLPQLTTMESMLQTIPEYWGN
jgi:hypothetical protein